MTEPARLSTCGRCGGSIERRPGSVAGWGHLTETARNADGHLPVPDDSAVARPDPQECNACHHPLHDEAGEELCETRIGTGLYGSDGIEVTRWCPCTGSIPCLATVTLPVNGRALRCSQPGPHGDGDHLFDAETAPDPWTDPDAAALASPPPF